METQNNFAIGSIPKHIMSIAGPMIIAQLINDNDFIYRKLLC